MFAACSLQTQVLLLMLTRRSFAPRRVSYLFGLAGPSVSIDTACSSSLVAAHYAVGDIQTGKVDASMGLGVSLTLGQSKTAAFTITGEGCGLVVGSSICVCSLVPG